VNKILFFTDGWFFNFGIAKQLQNYNDLKLYAIFDVDDKAKKFFQQQKIVKYEKFWYFMDFIKKTNSSPDLEYLKTFEQKYNINLWSIIYSDREFYNQYNNYYKFHYDEILSIVEQECKFFEMVIEEIKPQFLSIFMTVSHYHELLASICKANGIRILMLGSARFGNRMMISQEGGILDKDALTMNVQTTRTLDELNNYLKKFDSAKEGADYRRISFEENAWQRYKPLINFFFSKRSKNFVNRYYNFGRTRKKVLWIKFSNFIKKKYRNHFINKNFKTEINNKDNIIYFPLQMEPERVLLIGAPYYTNQISVITSIAKSLPVNYKLYVKEHPIMKILGWRNISYYKQILDHPNVVLIHPSISSEKILQKSSLIITIAGTAGQEAAFHGKPVITLTDQLYSHLPSVYKPKTIEELPEAIRKMLQYKINSSSLNEYVNLVDENTFELNLIDISADFSYRFGFKGLIMDAEMPISKVESFLNDYDDIFKTLANEHLLKIKRTTKE